MLRVPKLVLIALLSVLFVLLAGCTTATTDSTTSAPSTTLPTSTANWTVVEAGHGSLGGWLDGVDCVTATSCVAVGNESGAGTANAKALVETLHGGSWSAKTAPSAPKGTGDFLFSVSCPIVGSCVAVGYYFTSSATGGTGTALIETLAHGSWSVTPIPSLGHDVVDSFLNGVSCATTVDCVAVGATQNTGASTHEPLIMTLDKGKWSLTSGPSLGSQQGGLQGVSCTSPTSCTAAGWQSTAYANASASLVESLAGGSWSVVPSPSIGTQSWNSTLPTGGLNGVSCASEASCMAVGQFTGPVPTIDVLANRTWTAAVSPDPDPTDGATGLVGVSCTTTTDCVAVGSLAAAGIKNTPAGALGLPLGALVETYSAGTWTVDANPSGLPADSGLHDVSCVGDACVAVGQAGQSINDTSTLKTLIVRTGTHSA